MDGRINKYMIILKQDIGIRWFFNNVIKTNNQLYINWRAFSFFVFCLLAMPYFALSYFAVQRGEG
jgi:hypothetical protein